MNISLRQKQKDKLADLDIASLARTQGQGFTQTVVDLSDSGVLDAKGPWAKAAKDLIKKSNGVTKELGRGKYLGALEKEVSSMDAAGLPAHKRGRLAAVKKHIKQMREFEKSGTLTADAEKRGVSRAASSAFSISGDAKKSKGLFELAAKSSDHLTRDDMKKSFGKRGLVSDVAAERGMSWDQAAKGLGSLGLIGSKDPRLNVSKNQIASQKKKPISQFNDDEVKTGTAATSVMQLGRSLDEASATVGNRLNGAYKSLADTRAPKEPADKSAYHHGRAALAEATGLASLRSGGSTQNAMQLFAISGANTEKGHEALMPLLTKKKKKDLER